MNVITEIGSYISHDRAFHRTHIRKNRSPFEEFAYFRGDRAHLAHGYTKNYNVGTFNRFSICIYNPGVTQPEAKNCLPYLGGDICDHYLIRS